MFVRGDCAVPFGWTLVHGRPQRALDLPDPLGSSEHGVESSLRKLFRVNPFVVLGKVVPVSHVAQPDAALVRQATIIRSGAPTPTPRRRVVRTWTPRGSLFCHRDSR